MKEKISVLIPAFNREKYIEACIESILQQTYQPIQIIVYDDGSNDQTIAKVEKFNSVRLIKGNVNKGVGFARNQLIQACQTRYAAWQDSDDLSNINRIELLYHLIKKTESPIAFGYCVDMKHLPSDAWQAVPTTLSRHTDQCFGGCMIDLEKVRDISFNEDIRLGGEDTIWIKEVELVVGPRATIHQQLYYIRRHRERIGRWKLMAKNRAAKIQSDLAYAKALKRLEE